MQRADAQPPEEVVLGERARAQAALVLEQQLGATWLLLLEAVGAEVEGGWSVVVDGLRLVRQAPVAAGDGRLPRQALTAHPPLDVSS
jgi:hypothetical protein